MSSSKKNELLVTVIIPAYNAEDTISDAIDSILKQSLDSLELIVVDDGSTDNTGEIIDEYVSLNKHKIIAIHKNNAGVSTARNAGLDIARGKYIGFIDADDTVSPQMYEELIKCAEEKNADLVQCWRYDVDGDSKEIRKPHDNCTGKSIYDNPAIVMNNTMFVWDKLFRREVIEKNHIRFKPFRYAEDYLFLFQYEMHARGIEELKSPLYYYKAKRKGGVTSSYSSALFDCISVFDYLNGTLVEQGEFGFFEKYLWEVEAHFYIRRLNDFQFYSNRAMQEEIAKSFFSLFDKYFYDWKEKIKSVGTRFAFESKFNSYRSDWGKLYQYIYSPTFYTITKKSIKEKIIDFLNRIEKLIERIKIKIPLMKYAEYRKLPIKENAVLLTSYFGSSFSDSMYYMAKDLLERDGLEVYVGTNSIKREWEFIRFNGISPVLVDVNSSEYLKILATAKYLICNSRFPSWFYKRHNQVYLNTWHGTPLKKLGKDMNHGLSDVGNNQSQFLICDYLLYPNEYTRDCMMQSFFLNQLYCGKVVLCGYPRNTIFFDKEDASIIRSRLGLIDKKVYIYMPTWRGETINSATVSSYAAELNCILKKLDQILDDSIVVFVKLHQVVMNKIKLDHFKHFRKTHPLYENYRFLNMADGLITDYSSVFFDYANSGKEIILFTYDYDSYMKERGTYFDMRNLSFTRINTVEALAEHLNKRDEFIKDDEYNKICAKYCMYDSINNAKFLNDFLLNQIENETIKVEDYACNSHKSYRVNLMSALYLYEEQKQFEELISKAGNEDLFVFSQQDFGYETERLLIQYANSGIKYVIIPGDMPETFIGFFILYFYRVFKLFPKLARRLYLKDMARVLPNITIKSIVNYSNIPKFNDISRLLNNESC